MVLKICISSFLFLTCFACSSNGTIQRTDGDETETPVSAKELYFEYCSACHGSDGKLGAAGAKDLTKSTLLKAEVESRIEKGKNGMPPMKELLGSKKNITAVTEYVLRMR
jgi:mono/diheme cytochrome c family protein